MTTNRFSVTLQNFIQYWKIEETHVSCILTLQHLAFAWRKGAIQMWILWQQLCFKRNNEPLSFLQYMKERSYTNVKLVDIALLRKGIKKVQSIKEKSHWHVASIHEGKMTFKCDVAALKKVILKSIVIGVTYKLQRTC